VLHYCNHLDSWGRVATMKNDTNNKTHHTNVWVSDCVFKYIWECLCTNCVLDLMLNWGIRLKYIMNIWFYTKQVCSFLQSITLPRALSNVTWCDIMSRGVTSCHVVWLVVVNYLRGRQTLTSLWVSVKIPCFFEQEKYWIPRYSPLCLPSEKMEYLWCSLLLLQSRKSVRIFYTATKTSRMSNWNVAS
jgi:hypothetical protein